MPQIDLEFSCYFCDIRPDSGKSIQVDIRGIDIDDIIDQLDDKELQQVVDEIFHNRDIEDYIPASTLEKWAEENGYVKE